MTSIEHEGPAIPAPARPNLTAAPPITVIQPKAGWQAIDVREIWRYRDLLVQLTLREIQVRYKQTILGVFWAIIQPLATAGILAGIVGLLTTGGTAQAPGDVPHFVMIFCAMLPWQLFANSLTHSGGSLITNQRLITKVYFPRLIIPLSGVFSALADFVVALVALIGVMLWFGIVPGWTVVALPVFMVLAVIAALAVGLWLAALSALYRDFRHVIPFIIQIGMFLSPVMYTAAHVQQVVNERAGESLRPWLMILYGLNPMVGVIEGFRWALLAGSPAPGLVMIPSVVMSVVLLLGGAFYFRYMEKWFADLI